MPYPRSRHASWIVALLVAACSDAPTAPLPPTFEGVDADLSVLFPALGKDLLVTRNDEALEPPESAQKTIAPGEEPPDGADDSTTASGIYNALTFVYFNPDHVYAQGEHRYQGNKSKIVTTAKAYFDGELIGTQQGVREEALIFITSGLTSHYLQAHAKIYTDHTCGLAADASSLHEAWWEVFAGSPVSSFHRTALSTFADRRRQPGCPEPDGSDPSTAGGGSSGGMCWVEVWYDEATGEVLDWNPLYCESAGGG